MEDSLSLALGTAVPQVRFTRDIPVKSKLFSVILHYRYLSPKLLSSASQHKTMFHKNDIDRNRNNIGCVGGRRRLIHSIDSVPPGTSSELFKRRSPPIHPMLS